MITITLRSTTRTEMIDITEEVEKAIQGKKGALCSIFVPHTTAAICINEKADPNIGKDINNALSKLIPKGRWTHDKVDGNGDAHIKATMIGCSITVPTENNKLMLGQWQHIFFTEFDGPRERQLWIQVR